MPQYDVHLYPTIRLSLRNIEAESHEEALTKAIERFDQEIAYTMSGTVPGGWDYSYAEDIEQTAIVDELDKCGRLHEAKEVKLSDVEG